jgi:hypothetical protein
MTPLWVHEIADHFWADAGGPPLDPLRATQAFPRELSDAITWSLPIHVESLSSLSIAAVDAWLAARAVDLRLNLPDRPLRACVLVHDGDGLLFVDAADDPAEQRFSLAHEVAHYLVEYALPRGRARERLGPSVLPVLDGHRSPSRDERIGAILAGVRLSVCLHLMERTPDGHPPGREVTAAERRADDLAFELLAPVDAVRARLGPGAGRQAIESFLRWTFGLPPIPASTYARQLAPEPPSGSLFRRLFSMA